MKNFLIKAIASCFGLGYLPKAPGTFGTLGGVVLFLLLSKLTLLYYITSTLLLFFIASIVASKAEVIYNKKDPGVIVIDEVVGFLVAACPTNFLHITCGSWLDVFVNAGPNIFPNSLLIILSFIYFRLFDILKPWPASYFNKKSGGFAVVLDDVVAGIYANILFKFTVLILFYLAFLAKN